MEMACFEGICECSAKNPGAQFQETYARPGNSREGTATLHTVYAGSHAYHFNNKTQELVQCTEHKVASFEQEGLEEKRVERAVGNVGTLENVPAPQGGAGSTSGTPGERTEPGSISEAVVENGMGATKAAEIAIKEEGGKRVEAIVHGQVAVPACGSVQRGKQVREASRDTAPAPAPRRKRNFLRALLPRWVRTARADPELFGWSVEWERRQRGLTGGDISPRWGA